MARDTVVEIKDRLSIAEIVAPYVKLKRAGRSLQGLCPFHKEKTPSFHVSPERGTWHCFGCGLGGDGFSFIEKIEGVDFKGALKILAEKAGVTIEYSQGQKPEDTSKKDRLRALMSRASEWYASKFSKSPAEEYAETRGFTKETMTAWRLGFAPDAWRALLEALTAEGFTIEELLSAGLIKEADGKQGTYYDRFRNRLMFPIRDSAGRVVAFTGRALAADDLAKYLNSPETELYHKSKTLFGLDFAKDAIRTRDHTLLMEGQVDVILAHQIGFKNAVALSGTALSEDHLRTLQRFSNKLKLVLDADRAGLVASDRSVKLALSFEMDVKAVGLPQGKDPADLITEDAEEFRECIGKSKPVVEFFLTVLQQTEKDPRRRDRDVIQMVVPLVLSTRNPIEADRARQATASALGVSSEAVLELIKRVAKQPGPVAGTSNKERQSPPPLHARAPREIRSEQLLAAVHAYEGTPLAKRLESEYCRITEAKELPSGLPSEPALFTAEQTFGENPSEDAADELLRAFEEAVIREAYQEAVFELRRAESSGDSGLVTSAQALCAKLSARLAAFGA